MDTTRSMALLGIPIEEGAGRPGCSMGPKALRIAGILQALKVLGAEVRDLGDVDAEAHPVALAGNARHADLVAGYAHAVTAAAAAPLGQGKTTVYLGGDHALSFGTVAAALRHAESLGRPLHVLWLDAHADFNTPQTSHSGNMHGMPAAYFCGEPGFDGMPDCPETAGPELSPRRRAIDRSGRGRAARIRAVRMSTTWR